MAAHPFNEEDHFPISEKVRFLSGVAAYPHGPKSVEVIETHMSWVFLAGELVYKLKKPVRYDFLDFSSIEKRCTAVADEVRLNRRLACDVYLSERPLRIGTDGRLTLNECGQVIDWMVKMRRLAKEQDLECVIASGSPAQVDVARVADRRQLRKLALHRRHRHSVSPEIAKDIGRAYHCAAVFVLAPGLR